MAKTYSTDELIPAVRNLAKIPNSESSGTTDADLLEHLNDAVTSVILPAIMDVGESYYSRAIRMALVANQSRYRVHERAAYNKARDVRYLNSQQKYEGALEYISGGMADLYSSDTADIPQRFYFEGNEIVLVPAVGGTPTGYLEQVVFFRPSDLVLKAECRKVTAVSGARVTLDGQKPAAWTSSANYDVHSNHSGAEHRAWDRPVAQVYAEFIEFETAVDGTAFGERPIQVGDWVALAGECAVPAIPFEWHPILVSAAALRLVETYGDPEAYRLHEQGLKDRLKLARDQMSPRVIAKSQKVRKPPTYDMMSRIF